MLKKIQKKKFSDLCPNLLNPYVDSQREQQTISCQERKKENGTSRNTSTSTAAILDIDKDINNSNHIRRGIWDL